MSRVQMELNIVGSEFSKQITILPMPLGRSSARPASLRYLHAGAYADGRFHIFGGANGKTDDPAGWFEENGKWQQISGGQTIKGRYAMGCAQLQNQIYLVGGALKNDEPCFDTVKYNPRKGSWSTVCNDSPPLMLPVLLSAPNGYLLLTHGMTISPPALSETTYLFYNSKWIPMSCASSVSPHARVGSCGTTCNSRMWVFGGQAEMEDIGNTGSSTAQTTFISTAALNPPQLFGDLWEVRVNETNCEVVWQQIKSNGKSPEKRTGHAMSAINDKQFIVYGGQGLARSTKKYYPYRPLNDMHIFDTDTNTWFALSASNALQCRGYFPLISHDNELLIFGGCQEAGLVVEAVRGKLNKKNSTNICQLCIQSSKTPSKHNSDANMMKILSVPSTKSNQQSANSPSALYYRPKQSIGMLHNMAQQTKFPFIAIASMISLAEGIGSTTFSFNSIQVQGKLNYLQIRFDGKKSFSDEHFAKNGFVGECDSEGEATLTGLIRSCFRLGRSVLYISKINNVRKVLLLSADSKVIPDFQDAYNQFSFVQCLQECSNAGHRQAIFSFLQSYTQYPSSLVYSPDMSSHNFYVFQPYVIATAQRQHYYQLIFFPQGDVQLFQGEKRMQMLKEIGYDVSKWADYSLKAYLQLHRLYTPMEISLNNASSPLQLRSYEHTLQLACDSGYLTALPSKPLPYIESMTLYYCNSINLREQLHASTGASRSDQQAFQQGQGILLYCEGVLVGRVSVPFGELMAYKFWKKRYRGVKSVWDVVGVVMLDGVKLNRWKTAVQEKHLFRKIVTSIEAYIHSITAEHIAPLIEDRPIEEQPEEKKNGVKANLKHAAKVRLY